MKTFTQSKHAVRLGRLIRTVAIVVAIGSVAAIAGRMPLAHHADAAAATSETVVSAHFDYFPAQFAAPKGEPEAHVEAF